MTKGKKTTVYDIAALAGVSTATVSRVLNNSVKVDFNTRKRVLELCRTNNYYPSAKKRTESFNIGVVINKVHDPSAILSEYVSGIIQGALEFCQSNNITLSIFPLDVSAVTHSDQIVQELFSRDIQGAIFINPRVNAEYVESLASLDYPFISVGSFFTNPKISNINIDNREGIRLAVEHLKELGHEDIRFVTIQSADYDSMERMEAFTAYTTNGISTGNIVQMKPVGGDHKKTTFAYFDKKMSAGKYTLPDAYICLNDNVAIGVIHALAKYGVRVPEDVSVVGYDNYDISRFHTPAISSVENPIMQTGYLACSTIMESINGNKAVLRRLIIPTFIKRDSSGVCPKKAKTLEL